MNIRSMTRDQIKRLTRLGAKWLCISTYDHGGYERNEVISWHKTYDRATRAAGPSQLRSVYELSCAEPIEDFIEFVEASK